MSPARVLVLAAVLALGIVFGFHGIADPDLPQHVAVGRQILEDPASLGVSNFTYTHPGFRYVEDKWLGQVVAATVDRLGGTTGWAVYSSATRRSGRSCTQSSWTGSGSLRVGSRIS